MPKSTFLAYNYNQERKEFNKIGFCSLQVRRPDFKQAINAAIGNGTFSNDPPSASRHPGMSNFGSRQNQALNALQVGIGPAGAFVDIDRGNPQNGLLGAMVHFGELMMPGKTDPFAVGRALGKEITGYECK